MTVEIFAKILFVLKKYNNCILLYVCVRDFRIFVAIFAVNAKIDCTRFEIH